MGFWSWLLRVLSEEPSEKRGKRKSRDRYIPGGLDRFQHPGMKQPFSRFRSSFGDYYDEEEEED